VIVLNAKKFLYCAIDYKEIEEAERLLCIISHAIGGIKLGLEFFISNGINGVNRLKKFNLPIFLDLKLHDIPNTVSEAINAALIAKPDFISVHINGGTEMLKIISKKEETKIIGVSMLTSLDERDLVSLGINISIPDYVKRLVKLASECDLEGVVCSPNELKMLREIYPKDFVLITPGIRLENSKKNDDQKRISSPGDAIKNGSDILIIGRPITRSKDPLFAIQNIQDDIIKKSKR
tara:strand:+ start:38 stop:745 length:708 start_codon:yes stop_codon:yes gene_type:complete